MIPWSNCITSFTDNTDQSVGGNNYSADGSVRLTGGLGVAKNLAVGEDFTAYGNFVVKGNTTQTGTTVTTTQLKFLTLRMQRPLLIIQYLSPLMVVQELVRMLGLVEIFMFGIMQIQEMHSMLM